MNVPASKSPLRRNWTRLLLLASLAIFVASVVVAVLLKNSYLRRREAIMEDAIATFGWRAVQAAEFSPRWARDLIGVNQYPNGWDTVIAISLDDSTTTDDDLADVAEGLKRLPDVRGLGLNNTMITDRGLTHLKHLSQLEYISLSGTRVTDAGITDLKLALPRLTIEK